MRETIVGLLVSIVFPAVAYVAGLLAGRDRERSRQRFETAISRLAAAPPRSAPAGASAARIVYDEGASLSEETLREIAERLPPPGAQWTATLSGAGEDAAVEEDEEDFVEAKAEDFEALLAAYFSRRYDFRKIFSEN